MANRYRSPEWRELSQAFEEWWFDTTEFINCEGEHYRPRPSYAKHAHAVIAGIHDLTSLDPQPVWDLYTAVHGWHQRTSPPERMLEHRESHPIEKIEAMARRVQLHQAEIFRLCVVDNDIPAPDAPDGPLAVGQWRSSGVVLEGMPPAPWLLVQALFVAENRCLDADAAFSMVEKDEHSISNRDKVRQWYSKANSWFKASGLSWRIRKSRDNYLLENREVLEKNLTGTSEEPA